MADRTHAPGLLLPARRAAFLCGLGVVAAGAAVVSSVGDAAGEGPAAARGDGLGWVALGALGVAALVVGLAAMLRPWRAASRALEALTGSVTARAASLELDPVLEARPVPGGGPVPPGPGASLASAVRQHLARRAGSVAGHRAARAEAEAVDRYETEFLRTLNHELRTPMNAILGFSQVLLDQLDGPLSDDDLEDVRAIHDAARHLRVLVDDVLDLAALQSGKVSVRAELIDAGALVAEVLAVLSGQKRAPGVAVEVELAPGLPPVLGDPTRVRQILINLGTNALKFTERGAVTLVAAPHPEGVLLGVRDTGPGIAARDLGRIFEEYEQVASRQASKGMGLGLAICRRLAELQHGRMEVESVLGQGSFFRAILPAGAT